MELERKSICPLLKKKCIQLDCAWFVKVQGTDPQDKDKVIDTWDCALVWNLTVGLEIAKRVSAGANGLQKAQESFRNEFVKATDKALGLRNDHAPLSIEHQGDG